MRNKGNNEVYSTKAVQYTVPVYAIPIYASIVSKCFLDDDRYDHIYISHTLAHELEELGQYLLNKSSQLA